MSDATEQVPAAGNTVLLTGARGFVGQRLLSTLESDGLQVRTLQRPEFDILLPDTLADACRDVDTVYHLAAYAHVNQARIKAVYATNVDGTANLLEAAVNAGVRRFVYVSSILADPAYDQPRTAYGDSKARAEQLLMQAHHAGRIEVVIVRPVNVYGPGMKGNLMTLLRLTDKGMLPPLPRFDNSFSLIGVDDLCRAIALAGEKPLIPGEPAPVYPLTDGQLYNIKQIERALRYELGKAQPRWVTPRFVFYVAALKLEILGRLLPVRNAPGLRSYRALARNYSVDDAASQHELGYNPQSSFYSTLPAIVAAHRHATPHHHNARNGY